MSIKKILSQHKLPFSFTFLLILMESLLTLLYPLGIGYAVDCAISGEYSGILPLGALGLVTLIVGMARRFFDSRFYARMYQKIGSETVSRLENQDASVKSARLGMIKELVEFLEFSLPELINAIIALFGVIIIVATLNLNVFFGTLISTLTILGIYWVSGAKTIRFNKGSNDELEKQVKVISKNNENELEKHLKKMMKWNIKLSDLEALNFSLAWLVLMVFLIASILISIDHGVTKYGALFSLIMYVFLYMENVISLPFFYQNYLRLKEITHRILKA